MDLILSYIDLSENKDVRLAFEALKVRSSIIAYLGRYHAKKHCSFRGDYLFNITVVFPDWLDCNPYHHSSCFTVADGLLLEFKILYQHHYCWKF